MSVPVIFITPQEFNQSSGFRKHNHINHPSFKSNRTLVGSRGSRLPNSGILNPKNPTLVWSAWVIKPLCDPHAWSHSLQHVVFQPSMKASNTLCSNCQWTDWWFNSWTHRLNSSQKASFHEYLDSQHAVRNCCHRFSISNLRWKWMISPITASLNHRYYGFHTPLSDPGEREESNNVKHHICW